MKVTITYEYDPKQEPHYFAKATDSAGNTIFRGGENWTVARRRMIDTLEDAVQQHTVPDPETVEIEARQ